MDTGMFQCFRASCGVKGNMIRLAKDFGFKLSNGYDPGAKNTRAIFWQKFKKREPKPKAVEYMEQGHVVFFAGGTGHPYFSTDMAVVLRAVEIGADAILAGKAIDGVYTADPKIDPEAKKIDKMTMQEIVDKKLGVIDLASAVLAMENHMPMLLFGLAGEDSIVRAVNGPFTGTEISAE